jgi:6-phosphogluconolactonase (cycloisomerase 2 family)
MQCEPETSKSRQRTNLRAVRKLNRMFAILALTTATSLVTACGGGGNSSVNPPPTATEWFFVDSVSGNVSGFSNASGRLEPLPGSSVNFPITLPSLLTSFAVKPTGMFLAGITVNSSSGSTLQIANIASGGAISLTQMTATVTNPLGLAISSQGVIAISDGLSIQFFTVQNNSLVAGPAMQTSVGPEDLAFRADGKVLYALNAGSGISVFSVAQDLSLQLIENLTLPIAAGQLGGGVVRIRLSAAGNKIAASTLDGWLYVGDVNGTDGMVSGITETQVHANANLEDVVLDPNGQNVYTADQDNGGIYEFSTAGGNLTPLANSPIATLPGVTGLETDSGGAHLYAAGPGFPQSQIVTFSRDLSTGSLTSTGESVSTGGFLTGRIVRTAAH